MPEQPHDSSQDHPLVGPLKVLSASADEQEAYLREVSAVSAEDLPHFLDVLASGFGDGLLVLAPELAGREESLAALSRVAEGLRDPDLRIIAPSGRAWVEMRDAADAALAALRRDRIIPDLLPFRLIPVRFAPAYEAVAGPNEGWISVALTQAEADRFIELWDRAIPPSTPMELVTVKRVEDAAAAIYKDYPALLGGLRLKRKNRFSRLFGSR